MKTFGTENIEWRDVDNVTHVIVATKNSSWSFFCRTNPKSYVTWDKAVKPIVEEPTEEPVTWKHDRAKVKCAGCIAMLDGATITFVPVSL